MVSGFLVGFRAIRWYGADSLLGKHSMVDVRRPSIIGLTGFAPNRKISNSFRLHTEDTRI